MRVIFYLHTEAVAEFVTQHIKAIVLPKVKCIQCKLFCIYFFYGKEKEFFEYLSLSEPKSHCYYKLVLYGISGLTIPLNTSNLP